MGEGERERDREGGREGVRRREGGRERDGVGGRERKRYCDSSTLGWVTMFGW